MAGFEADKVVRVLWDNIRLTAYSLSKSTKFSLPNCVCVPPLASLSLLTVLAEPWQRAKRSLLLGGGIQIWKGLVII